MSKSVKRLNAPKHWRIPRRTAKWVVKPSPGPHPKSSSIPLLLVVRDMLKLAESYREARMIIKRGEITVDGVTRKDHKFPVGFMDVIGVPKLNSYYRVVPSTRTFLKLVSIPNGERNVKICRVNGKTTVRGGCIQLNLHDGRNILLKVKNPFNPVEDIYKRLDSLEITLPDQRIVNHFPFKEGNTSLVFEGENVGKIGKIAEIKKERGGCIVKLEALDGDEFFSALAESILVIGEEKPSVVVA